MIYTIELIYHYILKTNNLSLSNEYKLNNRYCIKNYIETDDPTKNVFISLLKVYLQPSNGEQLMLEPAIRLLSRHGSHVSASDVSTLTLSIYLLFNNYITFGCEFFLRH
jgi:hypothetical protein